jgi:uncharacterized protein YbjT (DUF2867 family)
MYVVTGATGNTGSVVAQALLAKGEKVRIVGRSKERLAPLVSRGAEAFVADLADATALTRAFDGARAVYFMVPPDPASTDYRDRQTRIVDAGAQALAAARVRYAVTLSSLGVDQESGTGPVLGLRDMESRLNRIDGLNVLHLRAGYFMEDTLAQVEVIRHFAMTAGPLRADLLLPMIASQDIGVAAADALLKLDFSGQQTRKLLGSRDLSYNEATRIIGAAIGKPDLAYMQLPGSQFIQALTTMGMSQNFAELILEMSDALNDGRMNALETRSPATTTPTSFEAFVQGNFLPLYRGKAAGAK